ncbi:carbohydrate ABC transporter membrane protein 2, CUT1 family [Paenibacillus sp. UNC496MF]|uniref:carbohydrate ABC transporter permease n=1 Tax=Paenibacillus sp. UNC496MF TaxID=1502753 RepID=UPI0008ED4E33|nr:carbohydrate ABC transporter permease [Paenibacillus sp. UNC496MF]SFI76217.1 carbohydrate ABC transporter membrane protein 2, CUT1 family [Paenibacillus sp. UNC496MF]
MNAATVRSGRGSFYQSRKLKRSLSTLAVLVVLIGGSILFILPFWWMVSTSLKTPQEIAQYPPAFFPAEWHWKNYEEAWHLADFTRYTLNTLTIAVFAVIGHVLSNTFIAYGFAKLKFPGRQLLFSVLLGTMIIPGFVTLIPQYILFSKLHWVGTYLPLIVPGFFGGPFSVFMLRQFFMTIPNDLIEAAKIDGANHLYIWSRIMVPLAKPAVATIAILTFNGAWNDFLGPLLYVNDVSKYTLQIGLESFKGAVGSEGMQWHYLMAGSLIVLAPVVALFFLFQRYFIEGMNISAGTKG